MDVVLTRIGVSSHTGCMNWRRISNKTASIRPNIAEDSVRKASARLETDAISYIPTPFRLAWSGIGILNRKWWWSSAAHTKIRGWWSYYNDKMIFIWSNYRDWYGKMGGDGLGKVGEGGCVKGTGKEDGEIEGFGLLVIFETVREGFFYACFRPISLLSLFFCIASISSASIRITILQVWQFRPKPLKNPLITTPNDPYPLRKSSLFILKFWNLIFQLRLECNGQITLKLS